LAFFQKQKSQRSWKKAKNCKFGLKNAKRSYSSFSRSISFWMHTSLRISIGYANKQKSYQRFNQSCSRCSLL